MMRVALGQIECVVGDVAANVATMMEMAREAAGQQCDIVWFPELADTGYALSVMPEAAGAWPGLAYDAMVQCAKHHHIAIGVGLSERVGDRLYNSLAVFDAQGQRVAHYRKAHLFVAGNVDESACFTPGNFLGHATETDGERDAVDRPSASSQVTECVTLSGMSHGLSICYDLRFPELYRRLADRGATVLVNSTAWPEARWPHWDVLTRARAVENQAWFLGCSRVGCDEGVAFAGRSRIVSPTGEVIAQASPTDPELLIAEIDPAPVTAFRAAVPALAARRRDTFA